MNLDKSSNPTFSDRILRDYSYADADRTMTVQGAVNKVILLMALVIAGAAFTWSKFMVQAETGQGIVQGWMIGGSVAGFILALVISFKKELAPFLSPIYAVCEGLCIGALSAYFELMFPGLVMRAVVLTFGVLFAMLFLYKTRMIQATQRFRAIVLAATIGIAVAYLATFIIGLFGVRTTFMFGGGALGIVISLVIVVVAALNLILDFDFVEKGADAGLPAYFEWYSAFGLMVTLIWLYIEILRLLAILASSRD